MLGELELLSVAGVLGRGDSGALKGKQDRHLVMLYFWVGKQRRIGTLGFPMHFPFPLFIDTITLPSVASARYQFTFSIKSLL